MGACPTDHRHKCRPFVQQLLFGLWSQDQGTMAVCCLSPSFSPKRWWGNQRLRFSVRATGFRLSIVTSSTCSGVLFYISSPVCCVQLLFQFTAGLHLFVDLLNCLVCWWRHLISLLVSAFSPKRLLLFVCFFFFISVALALLYLPLIIRLYCLLQSLFISFIYLLFTCCICLNVSIFVNILKSVFTRALLNFCQFTCILHN